MNGSTSNADGPNPSALCMCGCGEPAPIAKWGRKSTGYVKRKPLRYIFGHHNRKSAIQYRVDTETGCWIWQRATTKGYGVMYANGKTCYAHRVFYEREVGEIPDGLCVDHLCGNPLCVNPEHLEPVTHAENTRRWHKARRGEPMVSLNS